MTHLADNSMNNDKKHISPKVIAFDFYDGATEGIALSVKQCGRCYFKLIAWDQDQDVRLYAVSKIDATIYERLLALFARSQETPSVSVWLPEWRFLDKKDEQEAGTIINSCKADACSSKLLALGEDIIDDSLLIININNQLMNEVKEIFKQDTPDDLSNWLPKLGS